MFGFLFGRKKKNAAGQQLIPFTHEVCVTQINGRKVVIVKTPYSALQSDEATRVAMRYFMRTFSGTVPVMASYDPLDTERRAIFVGPSEFTAALQSHRIADFPFTPVNVQVPFIPWFFKEELEKKAEEAAEGESGTEETAEAPAEEKPKNKGH